MQRPETRINKEVCSFLAYRDSIAGIATGYGLDDRRVRVQVPVGCRIFSSPRHADRLWGPSIQCVPGALSTGVNRPGREAKQSPPTNTENKKMWIYTPLWLVLN
jgi:hypothetical protein